MSGAPVTAFVGIGANLGDARNTVLQAIGQLAQLPACDLLQVSSLYRTAPIDAAGDDYINAVAAIATTLAPLALLQALQGIEQQHGRERPYRNAPRTLDLDLLLAGDLVLDGDILTLPHPRMTQRAFVLVPLFEIAPDLIIAGYGPLHRLLDQVGDQPISKLQ